MQPQEILSMVAICKDVFPLQKIAVGHPYSLTKKDGAFQKFVYEINQDEQLVVTKQGDIFTSTCIPIEYETKPTIVEGTIQSNLFAAVTRTGEHDALAYRLADMFAWDIDFLRDIREGDHFRVLVEKRYREGNFKGYGHIMAAEFINQGQTYYGFLFKDAEGQPFHYDENGKSLRKAFLKAPLNFRRISSKYTLRRLHPVHKVYKPHQGIDYAAAMGTPVWAVGDGTITHAGWKGAAGRMIKVRHGGMYETYYLHLRSYAKGLKIGSKVRQGQVIGYVGSSGTSTGPHLDFRMKKKRAVRQPHAGPHPLCPLHIRGAYARIQEQNPAVPCRTGFHVQYADSRNRHRCGGPPKKSLGGFSSNLKRLPLCRKTFIQTALSKPWQRTTLPGLF